MVTLFINKYKINFYKTVIIFKKTVKVYNRPTLDEVFS